MEEPEFVPHTKDPLLTLSNASRLIGLSPPTIRRWVKEGLIVAVTDRRGVIRIRQSELIRFATGASKDE